MDGVFVELREGPEPGGAESRSDGVGVGAEGVSATALGAQLWHLSDSRGPRLSGFAFQEQNKSQAKKLGTGASPVLRWRGASALGLCSKLSGLSLVPSPLPDSPLWPQLRKTQAHK